MHQYNNFFVGYLFVLSFIIEHRCYLLDIFSYALLYSKYITCVHIVQVYFYYILKLQYTILYNINHTTSILSGSFRPSRPQKIQIPSFYTSLNPTFFFISKNVQKNPKCVTFSGLCTRYLLIKPLPDFKAIYSPASDTFWIYYVNLTHFSQYIRINL